MTTAKIKVLDGLDHVRLRPEMYIGSTYNPSHLVTEVLDNALDELVNNYANKVTVDIAETTIQITDNGRGIPIHNVPGFKEDSIVISATKLFSGAKFDNKAYGISIGLHGVGLAVTNALSNWMIIEVAKGDSIRRYEFSNSELSKQSMRRRKESDPSTLVSFEPDPKHFTTISFGIENIRKRLYLISARVKDSEIFLNREKIPTVTMDELARYYLNVEPDIHLTSVTISKNPQTITTYITYDTEKVLMGDVNLNLCTGTYLTSLTTLFAKACVERYPSLTRSNSVAGLKIYCSAFIQDPRFEGQVKNKMVKDIGPLLDLFKPKFDALIRTEFFATHLQSIVDNKARNGATKKLKRVKMVTAGNPLKDCSRKPGNTMFIVEGDSAGGTFTFRDNRTEAVFPLSGKILNTVNKNIDEVLDSKKMKWFLEAIGVDPKKKNQNNFRYNDFVIVTDADSDGGHITVLVILAIWRFAPEVIRGGHLKLIMPPLYGTYINKQFVPIYDDIELTKYRKQGYETSRYKGLGEMDAEELEVIVRSGIREYQIEAPKDEQTEFAILSCITNTDLKRKLCNDTERYNLQRIFDAM